MILSSSSVTPHDHSNVVSSLLTIEANWPPPPDHRAVTGTGFHGWWWRLSDIRFAHVRYTYIYLWCLKWIKVPYFEQNLLKSAVGCLTSHDVLNKNGTEGSHDSLRKGEHQYPKDGETITITTEKGVGNKELDILSASMSKSLDIVPSQSISKLALGF